jgi:isochorismate synthase
MNQTQSILKIDQSEILDILFQLGLESGGSFAIWRRPKTQKLEFILDESQNIERISIELEDLHPGFIVHPFADQDDKKAFFIKASHYFSLSLDQEVSLEKLPNWIQRKLDEPAQSRKSSISKIIREKSFHPNNSVFQGGQKEQFTQLVKLGIQSIQNGILEKIVPARTKALPLPENFDLGGTFRNLLSSYPNSFVNFFHVPQVGTWIGASPEVLIETKGDLFYTMSLAGTQKATGDNPLKSVAWTQKEIEEQALVSRYIVDCFKKIRLREYEEHGPKTVLAGNLLHLRSDFKVDMKATNFQQLGSVMVDLLHPTSAVCGMPRKEAHDFLQENEGFDRSFFAGFLGPVNIESETSLYVNLRTANIRGNQAILFAGAGVTEDSDPEKEWEETELKCEIIGKFIQTPSA